MSALITQYQKLAFLTLAGFLIRCCNLSVTVFKDVSRKKRLGLIVYFFKIF